jgi:hypothetical protein
MSYLTDRARAASNNPSGEPTDSRCARSQLRFSSRSTSFSRFI